LVIDIKRKRAAMFAGKSMRTDMITSFPSDNGSHRIFDPFVKVAAEPIRNGKIPSLGIQKILLETC
jgi:hypothetical protein